MYNRETERHIKRTIMKLVDEERHTCIIIFIFTYTNIRSDEQRYKISKKKTYKKATQTERDK